VAIARASWPTRNHHRGRRATGDLDRKSAEEVLELLATLNAQLGKTVVMVTTHDPYAAGSPGVQRRLEKGLLT